MINGITVLPERFTRVAPAGGAPPTCVILLPVTTIVVLSRTRPSPTMTRAPSYAVTCALAEPAISMPTVVARRKLVSCLQRIGTSLRL
jgi:hypothetical protein